MPLQEKFIFRILDMMNDDDDEVRQVGAQVAARITAWAAGHQHEPQNVSMAPLACRRLCRHLLKRHGSSKRVIVEAFRRLLGCDDRACQSLVPVNMQLEELCNEQDVLFAVEKSNLYSDPVKEARVWMSFLERLPAPPMSPKALRKLCQWSSTLR